MSEKKVSRLPEYISVNATGDWTARVLQFLEKEKIDPTTLSGAYSGETDLHIFGFTGTEKHTYRLMSYEAGSAGTADWVKLTKELLGGKHSRLLGISGPNVWILSWD